MKTNNEKKFNAYFIVTYGENHKCWELNYKMQGFEYLMNIVKNNDTYINNPNNLGFIISTDKCLNLKNYKYNKEKIGELARINMNINGQRIEYIFWAHIKCYYCNNSALYYKPILCCFKCNRNMNSKQIKYPYIYNLFI